MSSDPAVGAHPASGDLVLGTEDAGLEAGAALEREYGQIEVDGLSVKKAPDLLGKPGYGVT
jgi:hypothetical protein